MFDGQETRGKYHNWGYGLPAEIGRKFAQPGNDKTWFIELQAQLSWYHVRRDHFSMNNGMRIKEFEFRFGRNALLSWSFVWLDNRMDYSSGFSDTTFRIF